PHFRSSNRSEQAYAVNGHQREGSGNAVQLKKRYGTGYYRGADKQRQITLQGSILKVVGNELGKADAALYAGFKQHLFIVAIFAFVKCKQALALGVKRQAADQRNAAHYQRQVDAVPERDMVFRQMTDDGEGG